MAAADRPLDELFRLADAGGLGISVGVLEGATHREENGRTIPVAEYAMHNEFGTSRIPPRPAFRATADLRMDEWAGLLSDLLAGGVPAEPALTQGGGEAADSLREAIEDWATPPNAPSTIARKRSGRDNPLVNTGDLVDAVDFAIVRHG